MCVLPLTLVLVCTMNMDTLRALVPPIFLLLVDLTIRVTWIRGVEGTRTLGEDSGVGFVNTANFHRLTMWIEGQEIEHFVGYPWDILIVQDGAVAPYLREAYMDNLPVLPPEVTQVKISWMAKDQKYKYEFPDMRSLDPHVMYDPLMSIPGEGFIPQKKSTFQITLSCTGERTGIASMYLSLDIFTSNHKHIPGSPLKLHIRKRCIAFAESKTACDGGCKNGARCDSGKCQCKQGYVGIYCQFASCFPQCMNNGTCTKPGRCLCPRGYNGDRCEKAKCKNNCNNRGTCVSPNVCSCNQDYYGDKCQHRKGLCPVPCQNGGVCNDKNLCQCAKGYLGQFCQKPICTKSCGVHGKCVDANTCDCYRGWRGRFCHKTVNRSSKRTRKLPKHGGNVSRSERHIRKNKNKRRKTKKRRKKRTKTKTV